MAEAMKYHQATRALFVRASSQRFLDSLRGSLRILIWCRDIVIWLEPVCGPFTDIARHAENTVRTCPVGIAIYRNSAPNVTLFEIRQSFVRSEERRVGKECRSWWCACH